MKARGGTFRKTLRIMLVLALYCACYGCGESFVPPGNTAEEVLANLFQKGTDKFGGHYFDTNKVDETTYFVEFWHFTDNDPYDTVVFKVLVCGDGILSSCRCPIPVPEVRMGEMEVFIAEFNSRRGRAKLAIDRGSRLVESHLYTPAESLIRPKSRAAFNEAVDNIAAIPWRALSSVKADVERIVGAR